MKLGLLGYPIGHSKSPDLYQKFLGEHLKSYSLFSYKSSSDIPPLIFFKKKLDGLNITSPYKKHFIHEVAIPSSLVQQIGAINTLAFKGEECFGTNTDLLAIEEILKNYQVQLGKLNLLLLGSGVMAEVTKVVAKDLKIPVSQFSRKTNPDFSYLDLRPFGQQNYQTIIINSCSRDYIFQGEVLGSEIFWDYNYSFLPHQKTLPSRLEYVDGSEMLERQALAAIKFWETYL